MHECMGGWVGMLQVNGWLGDYMNGWVDSPVDTRIGR